MAVASTIAGGATHGPAVLTHAEQQVARSALAKLKSLGGGLGTNLAGATESATVFGGATVKTTGLGSTLIHGQGSETIMGGARSTPTQALANIGNDTVVSGSTVTLGGRIGAQPFVGHPAQSFNLSGDTINIKGMTADAIKTMRPEETRTSAHTVTLADKTTVTISGLSTHDVSKLKI
jgi:hypothetical protein